MRRTTFAVRVALLAVLIGGCTVVAEAQLVVSTQPPAPTSFTPVRIVVENVCCPVLDPTISRNGFVFDIPYEPVCLSPCITFTATYDVGVLPAGTYTVRIVASDSSASPQVIGTFVVAQGVPPVPVLDGRALMLLVAALALAGWLAMRHA